MTERLPAAPQRPRAPLAADPAFDVHEGGKLAVASRVSR